MFLANENVTSQLKKKLATWSPLLKRLQAQSLIQSSKRESDTEKYRQQCYCKRDFLLNVNLNSVMEHMPL